MSKSVVALDKRTLVVGVDGNGPKKEYEPSRRELLLEGICRSFGTELLEAKAYGLLDDPVLTRKSRPVCLTNQRNGRRFLLQLQYSRFCILRMEQQKLMEAVRSRGKIVEWEKVLKTYKKRVTAYAATPEYQIMPALFDQQILQSLGLTIGRYPKEIYAAIYVADNLRGADCKPIMPPFDIYDLQIAPKELGRPVLYIKALRQPSFFANGVRLGMQCLQDSIRISAPDAEHWTNKALELATSVQSVGSNFDWVRFSHETLVDPSVDNARTMAHIRTFIAAYTLGSAI